MEGNNPDSFDRPQSMGNEDLGGLLSANNRRVLRIGRVQPSVSNVDETLASESLTNHDFSSTPQPSPTSVASSGRPALKLTFKPSIVDKHASLPIENPIALGSAYAGGAGQAQVRESASELRSSPAIIPTSTATPKLRLLSAPSPSIVDPSYAIDTAQSQYSAFNRVIPELRSNLSTQSSSSMLSHIRNYYNRVLLSSRMELRFLQQQTTSESVSRLQLQSLYSSKIRESILGKLTSETWDILTDATGINIRTLPLKSVLSAGAVGKFFELIRSLGFQGRELVSPSLDGRSSSFVTNEQSPGLADQSEHHNGGQHVMIQSVDSFKRDYISMRKCESALLASQVNLAARDVPRCARCELSTNTVCQELEEHTPKSGDSVCLSHIVQSAMPLGSNTTFNGSYIDSLQPYCWKATKYRPSLTAMDSLYAHGSFVAESGSPDAPSSLYLLDSYALTDRFGRYVPLSDILHSATQASSPGAKPSDFHYQQELCISGRLVPRDIGLPSLNSTEPLSVHATGRWNAVLLSGVYFPSPFSVDFPQGNKNKDLTKTQLTSNSETCTDSSDPYYLFCLQNNDLTFVLALNRQNILLSPQHPPTLPNLHIDFPTIGQTGGLGHISTLAMPCPAPHPPYRFHAVHALRLFEAASLVSSTLVSQALLQYLQSEPQEQLDANVHLTTTLHPTGMGVEAQSQELHQTVRSSTPSFALLQYREIINIAVNASVYHLSVQIAGNQICSSGFALSEAFLLAHFAQLRPLIIKQIREQCLMLPRNSLSNFFSTSTESSTGNAGQLSPMARESLMHFCTAGLVGLESASALFLAELEAQSLTHAVPTFLQQLADFCTNFGHIYWIIAPSTSDEEQGGKTLPWERSIQMHCEPHSCPVSFHTRLQELELLHNQTGPSSDDVMNSNVVDALTSKRARVCGVGYLSSFSPSEKMSLFSSVSRSLNYFQSSALQHFGADRTIGALCVPAEDLDRRLLLTYYLRAEAFYQTKLRKVSSVEFLSKTSQLQQTFQQLSTSCQRAVLDLLKGKGLLKYAEPYNSVPFVPHDSILTLYYSPSALHALGLQCVQPLPAVSHASSPPINSLTLPKTIGSIFLAALPPCPPMYIPRLMEQWSLLQKIQSVFTHSMSSSHAEGKMTWTSVRSSLLKKLPLDGRLSFPSFLEKVLYSNTLPSASDVPSKRELSFTSIVLAFTTYLLLQYSERYSTQGRHVEDQLSSKVGIDSSSSILRSAFPLPSILNHHPLSAEYDALAVEIPAPLVCGDLFAMEHSLSVHTVSRYLHRYLLHVGTQDYITSDNSQLVTSIPLCVAYSTARETIGESGLLPTNNAPSLSNILLQSRLWKTVPKIVNTFADTLHYDAGIASFLHSNIATMPSDSVPSRHFHTSKNARYSHHFGAPPDPRGDSTTSHMPTTILPHNPPPIHSLFLPAQGRTSQQPINSLISPPLPCFPQVPLGPVLRTCLEVLLCLLIQPQTRAFERACSKWREDCILNFAKTPDGASIVKYYMTNPSAASKSHVALSRRVAARVPVSHTPLTATPSASASLSPAAPPSPNTDDKTPDAFPIDASSFHNATTDAEFSPAESPTDVDIDADADADVEGDSDADLEGDGPAHGDMDVDDYSGFDISDTPVAGANQNGAPINPISTTSCAPETETDVTMHQHGNVPTQSIHTPFFSDPCEPVPFPSRIELPQRNAKVGSNRWLLQGAVRDALIKAGGPRIPPPAPTVMTVLQRLITGYYGNYWQEESGRRKSMRNEGDQGNSGGDRSSSVSTGPAPEKAAVTPPLFPPPTDPVHPDFGSRPLSFVDGFLQDIRAVLSTFQPYPQHSMNAIGQSLLQTFERLFRQTVRVLQAQMSGASISEQNRRRRLDQVRSHQESTIDHRLVTIEETWRHENVLNVDQIERTTALGSGIRSLHRGDSIVDGVQPSSNTSDADSPSTAAWLTVGNYYLPQLLAEMGYMDIWELPLHSKVLLLDTILERVVTSDIVSERLGQLAGDIHVLENNVSESSKLLKQSREKELAVTLQRDYLISAVAATTALSNLPVNELSKFATKEKSRLRSEVSVDVDSKVAIESTTAQSGSGADQDLVQSTISKGLIPTYIQLLLIKANSLNLLSNQYSVLYSQLYVSAPKYSRQKPYFPQLFGTDNQSGSTTGNELSDTVAISSTDASPKLNDFQLVQPSDSELVRVLQLSHTRWMSSVDRIASNDEFVQSFTTFQRTVFNAGSQPVQPGSTLPSQGQVAAPADETHVVADTPLTRDDSAQKVSLHFRRPSTQVSQLSDTIATGSTAVSSSASATAASTGTGHDNKGLRFSFKSSAGDNAQSASNISMKFYPALTGYVDAISMVLSPSSHKERANQILTQLQQHLYTYFQTIVAGTIVSAQRPDVIGSSSSNGPIAYQSGPHAIQALSGMFSTSNDILPGTNGTTFASILPIGVDTYGKQFVLCRLGCVPSSEPGISSSTQPQRNLWSLWIVPKESSFAVENLSTRVTEIFAASELWTPASESLLNMDTPCIWVCTDLVRLKEQVRQAIGHWMTGYSTAEEGSSSLCTTLSPELLCSLHYLLHWCSASESSAHSLNVAAISTLSNNSLPLLPQLRMPTGVPNGRFSCHQSDILRSLSLLSLCIQKPMRKDFASAVVNESDSSSHLALLTSPTAHAYLLLELLQSGMLLLPTLDNTHLKPIQSNTLQESIISMFPYLQKDRIIIDDGKASTLIGSFLFTLQSILNVTEKSPSPPLYCCHCGASSVGGWTKASLADGHQKYFFLSVMRELHKYGPLQENPMNFAKSNGARDSAAQANRSGLPNSPTPYFTRYVLAEAIFRDWQNFVQPPLDSMDFDSSIPGDERANSSAPAVSALGRQQKALQHASKLAFSMLVESVETHIPNYNVPYYPFPIVLCSACASPTSQVPVKASSEKDAFAAATGKNAATLGLSTMRALSYPDIVYALSFAYRCYSRANSYLLFGDILRFVFILIVQAADKNPINENNQTHSTKTPAATNSALALTSILENPIFFVLFVASELQKRIQYPVFNATIPQNSKQPTNSANMAQSASEGALRLSKAAEALNTVEVVDLATDYMTQSIMQNISNRLPDSETLEFLFQAPFLPYQQAMNLASNANAKPLCLDLISKLSLGPYIAHWTHTDPSFDIQMTLLSFAQFLRDNGFLHNWSIRKDATDWISDVVLAHQIPPTTHTVPSGETPIAFGMQPSELVVQSLASALLHLELSVWMEVEMGTCVVLLHPALLQWRKFRSKWRKHVAACTTASTLHSLIHLWKEVVSAPIVPDISKRLDEAVCKKWREGRAEYIGSIISTLTAKADRKMERKVATTEEPDYSERVEYFQPYVQLLLASGTSSNAGKSTLVGEGLGTSCLLAYSKNKSNDALASVPPQLAVNSPSESDGGYPYRTLFVQSEGEEHASNKGNLEPLVMSGSLSSLSFTPTLHERVVAYGESIHEHYTRHSLSPLIFDVLFGRKGQRVRTQAETQFQAQLNYSQRQVSTILDTLYVLSTFSMPLYTANYASASTGGSTPAASVSEEKQQNVLASNASFLNAIFPIAPSVRTSMNRLLASPSSLLNYFYGQLYLAYFHSIRSTYPLGQQCLTEGDFPMFFPLPELQSLEDITPTMLSEFIVTGLPLQYAFISTTMKSSLRSRFPQLTPATLSTYPIPSFSLPSLSIPDSRFADFAYILWARAPPMTATGLATITNVNYFSPLLDSSASAASDPTKQKRTSEQRSRSIVPGAPGNGISLGDQGALLGMITHDRDEGGVLSRKSLPPYVVVEATMEQWMPGQKIETNYVSESPSVSTDLRTNLAEESPNGSFQKRNVLPLDLAQLSSELQALTNSPEFDWKQFATLMPEQQSFFTAKEFAKNINFLYHLVKHKYSLENQFPLTLASQDEALGSFMTQTRVHMNSFLQSIATSSRKDLLALLEIPLDLRGGNRVSTAIPQMKMLSFVRRASDSTSESRIQPADVSEIRNTIAAGLPLIEEALLPNNISSMETVDCFPSIMEERMCQLCQMGSQYVKPHTVSDSVLGTMFSKEVNEFMTMLFSETPQCDRSLYSGQCTYSWPDVSSLLHSQLIQCNSNGCGRFFHVRCLTQLLIGTVPLKQLQTELQSWKSDNGNSSPLISNAFLASFVCPSHWCATCLQFESGAVDEDILGQQGQTHEGSRDTNLLHCSTCPLSLCTDCYLFSANSPPAYLSKHSSDKSLGSTCHDATIPDAQEVKPSFTLESKHIPSVPTHEIPVPKLKFKISANRTPVPSEAHPVHVQVASPSPNLRSNGDTAYCTSTNVLSYLFQKRNPTLSPLFFMAPPQKQAMAKINRCSGGMNKHTVCCVSCQHPTIQHNVQMRSIVHKLLSQETFMDTLQNLTICPTLPPRSNSQPNTTNAAFPSSVGGVPPSTNTTSPPIVESAKVSAPFEHHLVLFDLFWLLIILGITQEKKQLYPFVVQPIEHYVPPPQPFGQTAVPPSGPDATYNVLIQIQNRAQRLWAIREESMARTYPGQRKLEHGFIASYVTNKSAPNDQPLYVCRPSAYTLSSTVANLPFVSLSLVVNQLSRFVHLLADELESLPNFVSNKYRKVRSDYTQVPIPTYIATDTGKTENEVLPQSTSIPLLAPHCLPPITLESTPSAAVRSAILAALMPLMSQATRVKLQLLEQLVLKPYGQTTRPEDNFTGMNAFQTAQSASTTSSQSVSASPCVPWHTVSTVATTSRSSTATLMHPYSPRSSQEAPLPNTSNDSAINLINLFESAGVSRTDIVRYSEVLSRTIGGECALAYQRRLFEAGVSFLAYLATLHKIPTILSYIRELVVYLTPNTIREVNGSSDVNASNSRMQCTSIKKSEPPSSLLKSLLYPSPLSQEEVVGVTSTFLAHYLSTHPELTHDQSAMSSSLFLSMVGQKRDRAASTEQANVPIVYISNFQPRKLALIVNKESVLQHVRQWKSELLESLRWTTNAASHPHVEDLTRDHTDPVHICVPSTQSPSPQLPILDVGLFPPPRKPLSAPQLIPIPLFSDSSDALVPLDLYIAATKKQWTSKHPVLVSAIEGQSDERVRTIASQVAQSTPPSVQTSSSPSIVFRKSIDHSQPLVVTKELQQRLAAVGVNMSSGTRALSARELTLPRDTWSRNCTSLLADVEKDLELLQVEISAVQQDILQTNVKDNNKPGGIATTNGVPTPAATELPSNLMHPRLLALLRLKESTQYIRQALLRISGNSKIPPTVAMMRDLPRNYYFGVPIGGLSWDPYLYHPIVKHFEDLEKERLQFRSQLEIVRRASGVSIETSNAAKTEIKNPQLLLPPPHSRLFKVALPIGKSSNSLSDIALSPAAYRHINIPISPYNMVTKQSHRHTHYFPPSREHVVPFLYALPWCSVSMFWIYPTLAQTIDGNFIVTRSTAPSSSLGHYFSRKNTAHLPSSLPVNSVIMSASTLPQVFLAQWNPWEIHMPLASPRIPSLAKLPTKKEFLSHSSQELDNLGHKNLYSLWKMVATARKDYFCPIPLSIDVSSDRGALQDVRALASLLPSLFFVPRPVIAPTIPRYVPPSRNVYARPMVVPGHQNILSQLSSQPNAVQQQLINQAISLAQQRLLQAFILGQVNASTDAGGNKGGAATPAATAAVLQQQPQLMSAVQNLLQGLDPNAVLGLLAQNAQNASNANSHAGSPQDQDPNPSNSTNTDGASK